MPMQTWVLTPANTVLFVRFSVSSFFFFFWMEFFNYLLIDFVLIVFCRQKISEKLILIYSAICCRFFFYFRPRFFIKCKLCFKISRLFKFPSDNILFLELFQRLPKYKIPLFVVIDFYFSYIIVSNVKLWLVHSFIGCKIS